MALLEHDPECTGCEHDCPWRRNPLGAPFCSICDDHWEALPEDHPDVVAVEEAFRRIGKGGDSIRD